LPGEDRLEQQRIFLRVIFQVRVLNDDNVSGSGLEPTGESGALTSIPGMKDHLIHETADTSRNISAEPSEEQSSTMMISISGKVTALTAVTTLSIVWHSS
jgi:hypothetical protein